GNCSYEQIIQVRLLIDLASSLVLPCLNFTCPSRSVGRSGMVSPASWHTLRRPNGMAMSRKRRGHHRVLKHEPQAVLELIEREVKAGPCGFIDVTRSFIQVEA